MCLKTQNSINSVIFFPSYKALGTSVSQAPIKTKRGKEQQKFYNPEKSARVSLTHRLLFGWGINFPIFGKTV